LLFPNRKENFPCSNFFPSMKKEAGEFFGKLGYRPQPHGTFT
jgi:hypothetical protein